MSTKGMKIQRGGDKYAAWLAEFRPDLTMLGEYATGNDKTLHRCQEGHEWMPRPKNIKQGYGCPSCDRMSKGKMQDGYWTKERCIADAKQYSTREEWSQRGGSASYTAAKRGGWIEECVTHMTKPIRRDNDVVYIWRDTITDLYKIGITSARLGEYRIGGNNKGMDPRIIFMLKVPDASAVESKLLELGADPEIDKSIDGHTEFRKLSNDELREAVGIAYSAALAA